MSEIPAKPRGNRLSRIWTLATATVTQLVRMRILAFLVVFCVLAVGAGFAFPVFSPEQQLKLLKDVSFGALQLFSMVMAIVATALLLPRDLEDRTLYTILSKPVPRLDYLLGKLIGVLLLIGGGLLIMDLILSTVLWLREGLVLAETVAILRSEGAPEDEIQQVGDLVGRQGLTWGLHFGVWAVFLKAAVITALTLLISTFASSTLFTIISSFCLVIIGHGQELAREYFFQGTLGPSLERFASLLLAIVAPDLRLFDIVDTVIAGEAVSLDAVASMSGAALMYLVGYMVVAHVLFNEKEL